MCFFFDKADTCKCNIQKLCIFLLVLISHKTSAKSPITVNIVGPINEIKTQNNWNAGSKQTWRKRQTFKPASMGEFDWLLVLAIVLESQGRQDSSFVKTYEVLKQLLYQ